MQPVKIGFIGCGNISSNYLQHAKQFPILDVAALSDLDVSRAQARAEEFGVPKACSVEELLADESIELVVNLTIPAVHAKVSLQIIEAGKHVYTEKPLAVNTDEGKAVLDAAKAKGVRVGNAPDTFLGTSHQACRALIESGAIGKPVAATAFMLCPGHESWHPDPDFYYQPGGGPMFDMGPYYLTALVNMLGPITRVAGEADIQINPRTITSEPKNGTPIDVNTPDHVAGTLRFADGCLGTIVTSFATRFAPYDGTNPITIYGTQGTLKVPDPNGFDGPVFLQKIGDEEYQQVDIQHTHPNGRSLGIADLATAIRTGRDHRANERLAYCVLEAMQGLLDSSADGRFVDLDTNFTKPALIPENLQDGNLDN
ncbi:Gfo/Idh/MocA family protein [Algisphaera agarilytica]|uniref:Putative dehydrogenase n=1 Tax=Algisphaera agarilytica TaxID=1385975 RepID=A0A7X0H6V9_9BACT|nr:Gfo/Idh/MocA family oxidoreductase [Algisphaera agarilytica]MBB6430213.1 putative dehydrogenase [Algisphaera agarilytica]